MQLYNTLSRRKETFKPLTPGKVGLYACGVTVYDDCHLGHARSCVAFEVLVRYLRRRGLQVTWVRNFTDIDDKILNRARETGVAWKEVAERYIASFQEDMAALGVPPAQIEPKATEHIPQILEIIRRLEEMGFAYCRPAGRTSISGCGASRATASSRDRRSRTWRPGPASKWTPTRKTPWISCSGRAPNPGSPPGTAPGDPAARAGTSSAPP